MTTREFVVQREPDAKLSWPSFPRAYVRKNHFLYRAVRNGRGPWWFCSCGKCRFDLDQPRGTCYTSIEPLCGLLECIGIEWCTRTNDSVFEVSFLQQWIIHVLRVEGTIRLANLTDRRALKFKVTNELSSMSRYRIPKLYARTFDEAKGTRGRPAFHGIRYRTRFDTGGRSNGVALFGRHGEEPWPSETIPVDDEIISQLRLIGIQIEEPPSLAVLDVTDGEGILDHTKIG
ncbi:hypothetical protein [Amycolatopsis sp. NPDC003861]